MENDEISAAQPLETPHPQHSHHLSQAEQNHLAGWNGLIWLDFLNMDPAGTFDVFQAERDEIDHYEQKEEESKQSTPLVTSKNALNASCKRSMTPKAFVQFEGDKNQEKKILKEKKEKKEKRSEADQTCQ
jgi:hypothetical protein